MRHLSTILIALLTLSCTSTLRAEVLSVSTIQLSQSSHYQVKRVYGGQLKHRRSSDMGFEMPGVIQQVHVQEGDSVDEGTPLVTLDQASINAQLTGALAEVDTAKAMLRAQTAQLELSRSTLARNEQLAHKGHISEQQLEELRQQYAVQKANLGVTETQLKSANARAEQLAVSFNKTVLRAPYPAMVQKRHLDEGSIVNPGAPVVSLVEAASIEATIGFPQNMVDNLILGKSYEFVVNKQQVPGTLKAILPSVDAVTGTVTTVFRLDAQRLFGGTLVELHLSVDVAAPGFWVPVSALAESQRGLWSVLAVRTNPEGESLVETRLVEILYRGDNAVYVRGTLEDGDLIVDSGTGRIVPGQNVRVASRDMDYQPAGS